MKKSRCKNCGHTHCDVFGCDQEHRCATVDCYCNDYVSESKGVSEMDIKYYVFLEMTLEDGHRTIIRHEVFCNHSIEAIRIALASYESDFPRPERAEVFWQKPTVSTDFGRVSNPRYETRGGVVGSITPKTNA